MRPDRVQRQGQPAFASVLLRQQSEAFMVHQIKGLSAQRPVLQQQRPERRRPAPSIGKAYAHAVRMERPVQSREGQA